ncbi:hypothetical protein WICMUC_000034 [Wickerhamomyces mucosus]|uniref:Uncharacterized protein n=1 Tax=Wickerhamomyces mucosus TaxID=1378264 RepID=A0A9P8PYW4_9ASCO|nr:hypothetical protein WICMUC_000034 [Wickerhamomyces mucosus]
MDLEQVLFGLDSFVNDCENDKESFQSVYKDSYIRLLDQLAVLLRNPETRDDELIKLNLFKFVECGTYLVSNLENSSDFRELSLELIRVLANAIADNNINRQVLAKNTNFIKSLGENLKNNFDDDELNERILILLKNLIIDSPDLAKIVSALITENLLIYLGYESHFIANDLFNDLIEFNNYEPSIKTINLFLNKFKNFAESKIEDEDEFTEGLENLSNIIDQLTQDLRLKINNEILEKSLQKSLFEILSILEPLEFVNKLKIQRKIYASIGNISSNLTCHNYRDLPLTLLKESNNGYIVSASMLIIGNSITSAKERTELIDSNNNLTKLILSKYNNLVDPVQFQGILHILKNLISYDTINELFTDDSFKNLELLIEATIRNSKYYTNFTNLLIKFLKKFIVLLNKNQVFQVLDSDIMKFISSTDINDDYNLIILLMINKVIVYDSKYDIKLLLSRGFKLNDNVTIDYLFELTKTLGVVLQHTPDLIFSVFDEETVTLLRSIKSIKDESIGSKAVKNNAQYISGTIINISKDYKIDTELLKTCKEFF